MTLAIQSPHSRRPQPVRWTGTDYDKAYEAGLFDGRRIELMNGELLDQTETDLRRPGRPAPLRWTGKQFDLASEMGLFEGRRVELINGEILEMPPMNDPHGHAVRLANYALLNVFTPDWATISVQCPMRLGEARPLPDLVVVNGTPREVATHPTTAPLIVEVSDSTLEYDQNDKATLYANNLITEYWIVNLQALCLEVRRAPGKRTGELPQYDELRIYKPGDFVAPIAAPQAPIKVADLLP